MYAVSAHLVDAAEGARELGGDTTASAREHLSTAMKKLSRADRLWGSVTTGCGHPTSTSQPRGNFMQP